MKRRLIGAIGIALAAMLVFLGVRMAMMADVPAKEFHDFLSANDSIVILAQQSSAPEALPNMVAIRFSEYHDPGRSPTGAIGFPDSTDLYTLGSGAERFECRVNIRKYRVCLVTLEKSRAAEGFKEQLSSKFPGLEVRWRQPK